MALLYQGLGFGDPSIQMLPTYSALKYVNITCIGLFGALGVTWNEPLFYSIPYRDSARKTACDQSKSGVDKLDAEAEALEKVPLS